jgi:hypothetical protein
VEGGGEGGDEAAVRGGGFEIGDLKSEREGLCGEGGACWESGLARRREGLWGEREEVNSERAGSEDWLRESGSRLQQPWDSGCLSVLGEGD